ncbi:MAG TPA: Ig-like domain-containing protein [Patescibacteria group bacterium]|nr:Ig-like domain-containing protein [Patescibacteria group bacterium]
MKNKKTAKPSTARKTPAKRAGTRRKAPAAQARVFGMRLHHAGLTLLVVAGLGWAGIMVLAQPILHSKAATCTISDKLVNSCRPWLGAAANNYTQVASDSKSQLLYHEQRIGRQLDLIHTYHPVGSNKLSATDTYFATRANTYLFTNWKPAANWADADGSNATVNAGIDQMAASVKALGSKKIFMTIHHEPENDVSSGASTCTTYKGNSGTPAQYRAMWRNVETRFANAGVTNVTWVMVYMNYSLWDCMVNDMYPGDDLVDWVMFDGYGHGTDTWNNNVGHFYNLLTSNSNSSHNYSSKTWGIVEWGYSNGTSAQHSAYFDGIKAALDANTFPKIKAIMVYDSRDQGSSTGASSRVAYDDNDNYSADQVTHYNAFANDPKITGDGGTPAPPPPPPPPPPAGDTTPPSVTLTEPSNNATLSGTVQVKGTATDNVGVTSVTIRVDNTYIATSSTTPYTFSVDTTKYTDGAHTITLRAWDAANNGGESATITVQIANHVASSPGSGGSTETPPAPAPVTSITSESGGSQSKPVPVTGTLLVNPTNPGSSVEVFVDGKKQPTNSIDTKKLTNGTHQVTIVENGLSKKTYISVHNSLPVAAVNAIRAHAAPISAATVVVLVGVFIWGIWPFISGVSSRVEQKIRMRQQRIQ